ncbi:MAG: hypothetical protein J6L79_04740 [Muribaculaceae bacterium]|nr:hypothetical protein [Muribaculaceae bacterium]
MNRILRAPWHDYTQRCIYMITLNKNPLMENFGILQGDYRIPTGQKGAAFISSTALGKAIKNTLRRFNSTEPNVRVLQYALMPDHLHILLFVEYPTEDTLGKIIARFKIEVNKAAGITGVFAKGFNDQILKSSRSLAVLYRYLRENARRLAVRRARPEFFRRVNALEIGGKAFQAYGNFLLLDCPFKEQVIVHRADSSETRQKNREQWLYTAANGGVLVSPFISPAEKEIRKEAGGRFILIISEPMGERYKPAGRDFELCEAGRLLIVSANLPGDLSRQTCITMNGLAQNIIFNLR